MKKSSHPADSQATIWREVLAATPTATRTAVGDLVIPLAEGLSERFYVDMLEDQVANKILNHHLVAQRLHASMARWVRQLFDASSAPEAVVAVQQQIGVVHARVGVSLELMNKGSRLLKRAISEELTSGAMPRKKLAEAILYVHEIVDLAVDMMNSAYTTNTDRMARADEAYRLFFLSQNMKAERERQKSQLLEWAQQILVRYYWEAPSDTAVSGPQGFRHSQFGLWLQHKASMLFEAAPELVDIEQHISAIEQELLPQLGAVRANPADARGVVNVITTHIDQIKDLLGSMFDRYIEVEDGRDSLTNLLNRRYLPSVAQREIALVQSHGGGLAALLVEIDSFQNLRETLGLEAADLVLAQVAATLTDRVRAGDFVFRVGEAQFLVLVVEARAEALMPLARGLCDTVLATPVRTPNSASTVVTVSIGIALFDGHPDYQRLVDRSNDALRAAHAQGPNCCAQAA